ncbi:MAG TPA: flippase [Candidatus Dormibacteraeota bacterium]|nr:flippase [Candidatus Dormibacteraeota bacterium]
MPASPWARGAQLLQNGVVRNALGLYVLQLGGFLLPIATIVFLARLLGPEGWGSLAFMQAFAGYVMLIVTYGFNYSATREVARHRDDPDQLAELIGGVLGAKLALTLLTVVLAVPLSVVVAPIHRHHELLWPAMLWAISLSFSLNWFYQGLERMAFVARWETAARVLALAGILLAVRSPADTWKVLAIQGATMTAAVLVELIVAYREVRFSTPTARLVVRTLRMGWSTFVYQGALSFYTVGNGFILGLFGSPAAVGYYVGAEKISKAFSSMLFPITQAVFPRISHLASQVQSQAAQLARKSLFIVGGTGCAMGLTIFFGAPILVRLVLGPGFDSAVLVLRILALLPPLIAVSNVLGIQWMLALGLDRLVNAVVISACVLNVVLAIVLAPRYLEVGMAVAVVASETLVASGLYAMLRMRNLDPLVIARRPAGDESGLASTGAQVQP